MSTRIRYQEILLGTAETGSLKSVQTFLTSKGETVCVMIRNSGFSIFDTSKPLQPIMTVSATSLSAAKKAAKEALVSMGVNFQPEVRNRKKSEETSNS